MRLRRTGWAGVEVESGDERLVIDLLATLGLFEALQGPEPDELLPPEGGTVLAALVTHLHRDHTDIAAIETALGSTGTILAPEPERPSPMAELTTGEAEAGFAATALAVERVRPGATASLGPFTVTAFPSSDGLGSPQVAWLVEADGKRVLHAGDTMWHGGFWSIADAAGPIDVAFLPGNGVSVTYPRFEPAVDQPIVMLPEQTVAAGRVLQAGTVVPMHHTRMFEHADYYRPVSDARARMDAAAGESDVALTHLAPGEWLEL